MGHLLEISREGNYKNTFTKIIIPPPCIFFFFFLCYINGSPIGAVKDARRMDVERDHGIGVVEIVFYSPSDGENTLVAKIDDYTNLAVSFTQRELQEGRLDHYCCCCSCL